MHLPGPTSRRVLPPGEYDGSYRQGSCVDEPSDVAFCQITLALVIRIEATIPTQQSIEAY